MVTCMWPQAEGVDGSWEDSGWHGQGVLAERSRKG